MDFQIRRPGVAGAFSIASALLIVVTTERIVAERDVVVQAGSMSIPLDCDAAALPRPESDQCRMRRRLEGQRLFEQETFGGNGRTCLTCHSVETGTISPSDVQQRLVQNPLDALFLHDGLDEGIAGTSRIEQHATVRVTLPLPAHLRLANDPGATEITFNRAVLTTLNAPALDRAIMWDLRAANLEIRRSGDPRPCAERHRAHAASARIDRGFQRTSPRFSRTATCGNLPKLACRPNCLKARPNPNDADDCSSSMRRSTPPARWGFAACVTAAQC